MPLRAARPRHARRGLCGARGRRGRHHCLPVPAPLVLRLSPESRSPRPAFSVPSRATSLPRFSSPRLICVEEAFSWCFLTLVLLMKRVYRRKVHKLVAKKAARRQRRGVRGRQPPSRSWPAPGSPAACPLPPAFPSREPGPGPPSPGFGAHKAKRDKIRRHLDTCAPLVNSSLTLLVTISAACVVSAAV